MAAAVLAVSVATAGAAVAAVIVISGDAVDTVKIAQRAVTVTEIMGVVVAYNLAGQWVWHIRALL